MQPFHKSLLLFLITAFLSCGLFAQSNPAVAKIAPSALREDFMLLRDTLQKSHPALYRYNSKAGIDHIFDSCLAAIKDSMPLTDFYLLTSYAMAAIGDGHAHCRLPKSFMDDFMSTTKLFPAMVLFINSRTFIYCCKQKTELGGAEILSINGHSMHSVVSRLFRYIQTDGRIQSRKNWELPEFFHLYYNTLYGHTDSFNIIVRSKKGDLLKTTLQGDYVKDILCANPLPRPNKYLTLTYTPDNIAILTIKTFLDDFLNGTGEHFRSFLDSAFNDIKVKKVTRLIIDGRRNQGGYDHNGQILYSYLTQKPFAYYASQETIKGKITETQNHDLLEQQPDKNNYSGKVFFLMDGRSFSGTAEFSSIARSNNRGLFIGEETGGEYYGNSSGNEVDVTLPNSQISCRIPLIKYTMAVKRSKYTDRGVIPDYLAYPTIYDFIEHKDSQLEYAIKLVKSL
ncbi:MAG: S41 family peptidase [Bacteroidota bacterium]